MSFKKLIFLLVFPSVLMMNLFSISGLSANDKFEPFHEIAPYDQFEGLKIQYLRIESDVPVSRNKILKVLSTKKGAVFTKQSARESLQNLYLLGMFDEIVLDVEPFVDGIMVTYRLKKRKLIRSVKFRQKDNRIKRLFNIIDPLPGREMKKAAALYPTRELNEEQIDEAVKSLEELCNLHGYYDPEIIPEVILNDETREATVVFNIHSGLPSEVGNIEFKGDIHFLPEHLKRVVHTKTGKPFSLDKVTNDRERLMALYRFYYYLNCEISKPEYYLDSETDKMNVIFEIEAEPPFKIRITAPKHLWNWDWLSAGIDPSKVYSILGFPENSPIAETMLTEAEVRLKNLYQEKGYHFASVERKEKQPSSLHPRIIDYRVNEGDKAFIRNLEIAGHDSFEEETLRKSILTKKGRPYVESVFQKDMEALRAFYLERGYRNVEIVSQNPEFVPISNTLYVDLKIMINEGESLYFGGIDFDGINELSEEKIKKLNLIQNGDPFSVEAIEESTDALRELYKDQGFKDVRVEWEASLHEDEGKRAEVTIKIEEGRRYTFGEVVIQGDFLTKRKVFDRLIEFETGDDYDYQKILDAQRKISQVRLFSSVRLEPFNDTRMSSSETLLLSVTERSALFFELGFGYNTDEKLRLFGEIGTNNLAGYNRSLRGSFIFSRRETRYQVSFREPWFSNNPIPFTANLFRHYKHKDEYSSKRDGGNLSWEKKLNSHWKALVEYRLESQKLYNVKDPDSIPEEDRETIRIGAAGPSLIYDSRDDPRDPHSGWLISNKLEWATKNVLGSEVKFFKAGGQATSFIPLRKKTSAGLSLRYGIGSNLPLQESFYAGGAKTIRGFKYESIHPPKDEEGNLAPGNAMLIGNLELRFPFLLGLEGVIFMDSGNVWESIGDVKLSGWRFGAGGGIRFMTPFGPIGLDIGYNLDPKKDEPPNRTYFVIGHAF